MSPKGKSEEGRPPGEMAPGASHPVRVGLLIMSRRKCVSVCGQTHKYGLLIAIVEGIAPCCT